MKLELRGESIALGKMRLQFLLNHQFKEGNPQITPNGERRLAMPCDPHLSDPSARQREAILKARALFQCED